MSGVLQRHPGTGKLLHGPTGLLVSGCTDRRCDECPVGCEGCCQIFSADVGPGSHPASNYTMPGIEENRAPVGDCEWYGAGFWVPPDDPYDNWEMFIECFIVDGEAIWRVTLHLNTRVPGEPEAGTVIWEVEADCDDNCPPLTGWSLISDTTNAPDPATLTLTCDD